MNNITSTLYNSRSTFTYLMVVFGLIGLSDAASAQSYYNVLKYGAKNDSSKLATTAIKNAIEATPESGKVTVRYNPSGNQANVTISDTGKGMTHEQLSRIGTLFYSTKDKGTGLGTSVSLRIIEAMNGKISYKSEQGIGTEVIMILPEGKKELLIIS